MIQQDEIISVSSSFSSFESTESYDIIDNSHIRTNLIYIGVLIYYKHNYSRSIMRVQSVSPYNGAVTAWMVP